MLHEAVAISWFENIGRTDVQTVGGKNASLGEMVRTLAAEGINVPPGFATTADVYWRYVDANDLGAGITFILADWDAGRVSLTDAGRQIRSMFLKGNFPPDLANEIANAYRKLSERAGVADARSTPRSSSAPAAAASAAPCSTKRRRSIPTSTISSSAPPATRS